MSLADRPAAVRVVITGDLCPQNRLEKMLLAGDLAGTFGRCRHLLAEADLAIVNLEAPLCRHNQPIAKLGPNFRADPRLAPAMRAAGVDVCCLANNHAMDYGPKGLAETMACLKRNGLAYVGAGRSEATAAQPLSLSIGGLRIAIVNFGILEGAIPLAGCAAARWAPRAIRRAVAKAAADHHVVLPILHAGKEEVLFPSPGMCDLGKELIDAGASAVVGHHPHVPQGIELYRGRPIVYSLGNFLFDWHEPEPHTDSSFLLELGVDGNGVAKLAVHPFRKTATGGVDLLAGRPRAQFIRLLNDISRPLTDSRLLGRLYRQQCRQLLAQYYPKRLKRGGDVDSADAAARLKAELTFVNLMQDDEHGEPLKDALMLRAIGRGRDDSGAACVLTRLNDRLRAVATKG